MEGTTPEETSSDERITLDGLIDPKITGALDGLFDTSLQHRILDSMVDAKLATSAFDGITVGMLDSMVDAKLAAGAFGLGVTSAALPINALTGLDTLNNQVLAGFKTPTFAEWAGSSAAVDLVGPSFGALIAESTGGAATNALAGFTNAAESANIPNFINRFVSVMSDGAAQNLVVNMPDLFPSLAPLQGWMTENIGVVSEMTTPIAELIRNANATVGDVTSDHIEFEVGDATVVLPELENLTEAYETGNYDRPSFAAFSEVVENSAVWRDAIDNAVARLRTGIPLSLAKKRAIVKLGVFFALTTILGVAALTGNFMVVGVLIASVSTANGVMGEVSKLVDDKVLPDRDEDQ
ncbi:putative membrane protein (plasmid) [Rhodococcus opacus]|uniref:Putative membrane protein n=1 Tax=Rhodococcus opacus TaxID=37919 RepID=A0A1B1KJ33_RHOOP|nr:hypothetical protein [Rhodococcus opacus]ANS32619.1 putative membrane protein [Rhodococcus opacus]